jgi:hypothetical protein
VVTLGIGQLRPNICVVVLPDFLWASLGPGRKIIETVSRVHTVRRHQEPAATPLLQQMKRIACRRLRDLIEERLGIVGHASSHKDKNKTPTDLLCGSLVPASPLSYFSCSEAK